MMRVMFVDDEPNILRGLQRMLRPFRHEWDMVFVSGAMEALEIMSAAPVDIVVSDMRMPEYDGAYLLTEVRRRYPATARIILSGHAQQEATIRSVSCAHQVLAKPCEAETLRETVSRTMQLRQLMDDPELRKLATEVGQLPSVPSVYTALTQEMANEDAQLQRVAQIVAGDVAMSAKILQLVNSAFFGLRRSVGSIEDAVAYLGLDIIRSLVLSQSAFGMFDCHSHIESAEKLARRGQKVAALAREITRQCTDNRLLVDEAFQAAMLHELGKLILASEKADRYRDLTSTGETGIFRLATERERLGVTHGEIGAYLLGLWGLADGIVEAVAFYAEPDRASVTGFAPLVAVHAARALHDELSGDAGLPINEDWLETVGLVEHLPDWRRRAQKLFDTRNAA